MMLASSQDVLQHSYKLKHERRVQNALEHVTLVGNICQAYR
jgi:hypothetical protein